MPFFWAGVNTSKVYLYMKTLFEKEMCRNVILVNFFVHLHLSCKYLQSPLTITILLVEEKRK